MATGREKAPTTAPMTLHRALKLARKRSYLSSLGRQYVLLTWSAEHRGHHVSQPMQWNAAAAALREARIRIALELLEVEEPSVVAHYAAQDPGRVDVLVKAALKADAEARAVADASKAEARAWGRS